MSVLCKRILGFFLSLLCILTGTGVCCVVCNHPSEEIENTVSSFYREPAGSLDVVMIGSSAAWKDFYPAVLWREQQITAYCFAIGACSGNIYFSVLQEVLSRQPDAVILIDADGFLVDDKFQSEQDPIRLWIDSMPHGQNRLQTIEALSADSRTERLFPFMRYHRNMTSLFEYVPITIRLLNKQIRHLPDPMKGATFNPKPFDKSLHFQDVSAQEAQPLDDLSTRVLDAFLQFCSRKQLQNVLFVNLPKTYSDDFTQSRNTKYAGRMRTLEKQAAQYGYKTLDYNLLHNPAQLDLQTDFADTLHLTTKGSAKFSAFLAEMLQELYTFADKDAETIERWNADTASALLQIGKDEQQ